MRRHLEQLSIYAKDRFVLRGIQPPATLLQVSWAVAVTQTFFTKGLNPAVAMRCNPEMLRVST